MNYHQYRAPIGVNASYPRYVSGASLAHFVRRMTPVQRAVLAVEILEGRVIVQALTVKTVATLVGTSLSSVYAALRCTPDRRVEVVCGRRPLQPTRAPVVTVEEDGWWREEKLDELLAAINAVEHPTAVEIEPAN
jgi:hypothetical protein